MDMGWSRRIADIEDASIEACIEHRRAHNLPTEDVLSIDCETECPIEDTCPLRR